MVAGGLLLTLNDAVLKWLTGDYPVGQIMFLRGLFVFIPITVLVHRAGGVQALKVNSVGGHAVRTVLVITGTFLFITGLRYLPLADAISITFAGPLFVTALAAPLLGENIHWRRWLAIGIGLIGVIVIVRPGGNIAQWAALLPLASSLTGACRDILTRHLAGKETSISILFYTSLGVTLAGGATSVLGWQSVTLHDVSLFALSGILLSGAHYLMIETYKHAEAAVVAPFKYVSMVWAVVLGLLIWGDFPDQWTFVGAAIVMASGLYILHRENITKRKPDLR